MTSASFDRRTPVSTVAIERAVERKREGGKASRERTLWIPPHARPELIVARDLHRAMSACRHRRRHRAQGQTAPMMQAARAEEDGVRFPPFRQLEQLGLRIAIEQVSLHTQP